jgi:replication factor C subunit 3/5
MFFPDKYAPKHSYNMFFHLDILNELEIISKKDNIPHMIFYGQPESGRRTLITKFLENVFDPSINKLTTDEFSVVSTGTSSKTIIQLKQSNYHVIIEPTGTNFDKHIISHVVKAYVISAPLSIFKSSKSFKVVLINNADKLTPHAQTALRRTMEKYSATCKFILWCTKFSSIIDPIKSRCLPIRVPVPTNDEIMGVMIHIVKKENIKLSFEEYCKIIKQANGRIKEALWKLQCIHIMQLTDDTTLNSKITYEIIIDKIIDILKKPNIKLLDSIKEIMYEIIITNLQPTQIIISIMEKLLDDNLTEKQKNNIIIVSAEYEHRALIGRRSIMQIEAFIIHLFDILHNKNDLKDPVKLKIKKNNVKD